MLSWFSCVCLFLTPWQDTLAMGFSRQEYWSGLPFPASGDLPNPGIKPVSPACVSCIGRWILYPMSHVGVVNPILLLYSFPQYFPAGSHGKESACNAGDLALIPGLGRFPGAGHGNPLECSYLENPMDKGAWWATVRGVAKSWTRLSRAHPFLL